MNNTLHLLAAAVLAACTGLAAAAPVAVTGDNHSVANAFAVDPSAFDRGADPDIDDATTTPHASLVASAAGPFDYYRIAVGSSGALTLDIDYSDGFDHAGLGLDLELAVWTLDGTLLALDDDDPRDWGFPGPSADSGSSSVLDPYVHLDGLSAGSYVVGVAYSGAQADSTGWLAGGEIPAGGMYVLQVSTDPAVTAVPEPGAGALWLVGLLGLAARIRQRKASAARG
jgi:MYXO-CTERM domain-containing protein